MATLLTKLSSVPAPETEIVALCPICSSDETIFLWWTCDRLYHLPGRFGTVRCNVCGLVRLSPRPTIRSIEIYYPEDYGAYTEPEFSIHTVSRGRFLSLRNGIRSSVLSDLGYEVGEFPFWQRLLQPLFRRYFFKQATYGYGERFPAFVKNGRALEVGCGNGAYLSYLKHHGWMVEGVDLSPDAAASAKRLFDIDVSVGQLSDVKLEPESFDYVHLSHVVEHFFNPIEELRKVTQLLKPGGRVYIEVPNAQGYGANKSGIFWYGWDAPRHLFTFSPNNLRLAAENSGLEVEKLATIFSDYFPWAMTYEHEDQTGEMLKTRPFVSNEQMNMWKKNRADASAAHVNDPLSGDFISCWLFKPLTE